MTGQTPIIGTGPITLARAALVRAAKTAAQAALGVLGAGAIDVVAADWQAVASVSAGAAIVSLLQSVAFGLPETGTVLATVETTEP